MTGQPGRSGGKREGAGRPPGGHGGRTEGAVDILPRDRHSIIGRKWSLAERAFEYAEEMLELLDRGDVDVLRSFAKDTTKDLVLSSEAHGGARLRSRRDAQD